MFIEQRLKAVRAKCEKSGFPPICGVQLRNLALTSSGAATRTSLLHILPESLHIGKCTYMLMFVHVCVVCVNTGVHIYGYICNFFT